jgi:hypothetical protein
VRQRDPLRRRQAYPEGGERPRPQAYDQQVEVELGLDEIANPRLRGRKAAA